jgi:hypothetical protein
VTTTLVRWGPPAVILSGALLVVKGLAIIVSVADPSLVPPATLLFAFGMVGLYARLGDAADRSARWASSSPGPRSPPRRWT